MSKQLSYQTWYIWVIRPCLAFPFITRGVQSFLTHLMPLSFYELAIQTLIIYLLKTILFVFLTWTIFKVFTEFVTIVFLLYVSVSREVSSRTKDWACTPCTEGNVLTTGPPGKPLVTNLLSCIFHSFLWILIFRIASLDVNTTLLGTHTANISTSLLAVWSISLSWLFFSDLKQNFLKISIWFVVFVPSLKSPS